MVRYLIDDVTDEMILGESIFTPSGELLLAAGYHIARRYRERLKELGFRHAMVEVEGTEGVSPEAVISEHLQRELAVSLNTSTKEIENVIEYRGVSQRTIREIIRKNRHEIDKIITNSGIAHALEKLIDEILNQAAVVLNLSAISGVGGDCFSHVMSVAVIALCIGRTYRLSYEEMKQLGTGAMNLDLGLVAVPREILDKPDPLGDDDRKVLNQHTVYGHLMLSQIPSIPATSSAVALQHHECQDGSGYPRGLKGENLPPLKDFTRKGVIHRFAEIVAVADTYAALTEGRLHYGQRHSVQDALRIIIGMGGGKLNAEIVKTLVSTVPIYPVGARIRIVNAPVGRLVGYGGVVARDNPENLEQPQIILYETTTHQRITPFLIDMAEHDGFTLELIT